MEAIRSRRLRLHPLVEVSYGRIAKVRGGVFDIASVYGADHFWSLSVGVRVGTGMGIHRMGRYGAMEDDGMEHHHPDGAME